MGAEVEALLTHLAVDGQVAASTQNRAFWTGHAWIGSPGGGFALAESGGSGGSGWRF
ncbi:hypothetical protein [Azovibrio sp.]|uniref:hypothetical protein n=1 Tax=Azovibrio sp. TaxID=1872673 RepID=UPI003C77BAEB